VTMQVTGYLRSPARQIFRPH